jgi:hypothetical protein
LNEPSPVRRRLLALLVALAFLHGLLWAVMMPPWQVPDEYAYFAAGQQAAIDAGWLAEPALIGPPAAMPTKLFAVTAAPVVAVFKNPLHGMYAMRAIGALGGALVVLLGFLAARALFPEDELIQWGTGLTLAMLPSLGQFFAYGSPDTPANLGGALLYLGAAYTITRGYRPWPVVAAVGGAVIAVASKQSGYVLAAVLAVLPLFALARPPAHPGATRKVERVVVPVITAAGLAGAFAVFARLVRENPAALKVARGALTPSGWLAALQGLVMDQPRRLLVYFWGRWGYDNGVQLADPWFDAFRVASLAAIVGLVLLAARWWAERDTHSDRRARLAALGFFALGAWASTLQAIQYGQILGGWVHARWLNPSIVPIVTLLVVGLAEWVPSRARTQALTVLAGFLAAFDAIAVWLYVRPHFYEGFPAELSRTANFVWPENGTANRLVFGPRPFFARWAVVPVALQLLLWFCLAMLLARAHRREQP